MADPSPEPLHRFQALRSSDADQMRELALQWLGATKIELRRRAVKTRAARRPIRIMLLWAKPESIVAVISSPPFTATRVDLRSIGVSSTPIWFADPASLNSIIYMRTPQTR